MPDKPVVVSLPIADRRRSYAFFGDGLGLPTVGDIADDGVPEPLQVAPNDGIRIMCVPTGGFGWVIGGREVAAPGHSECVVSLSVDTTDEVDAMVERARRAGAEIVTEPGQQPWGYVGLFADPDGHLWMVITA